ncbi:MAG: 6-carboxytetrahydropterin synthase QueD [Planctomycetota bacterium]
MYELIVKNDFSAAHHLRNYHGKCEKLHGHNYCVEIHFQQKKLNKVGMAIDFTELKSLLDKILSEYDHHYLNELSDFIKLNPTAENIAYIISKKIRKKLPKVINLKVCVWESSGTGACYFDAV